VHPLLALPALCLSARADRRLHGLWRARCHCGQAADAERTVIAFAGDGDFLMTGQELATAMQYELPIIIVIADNGMYGTIRMHQERHYPARVIGTELKNPDFAALARAYGAFGALVEKTADFTAAFGRRTCVRQARRHPPQGQSAGNHARDHDRCHPQGGAAARA
jgi:hypothetical protein